MAEVLGQGNAAAEIHNTVAMSTVTGKNEVIKLHFILKL